MSDDIVRRLRIDAGQYNECQGDVPDVWPRIAGEVWARGLAPARARRSPRSAPGLVAAAVLLLLAGFAAGRIAEPRGTRVGTAGVGAMKAERVQYTGSAFVGALASLDAEPSTDARRWREARMAALGAVLGASVAVARLAPDDPSAQRLLQVAREALAEGLRGITSQTVVRF